MATTADIPKVFELHYSKNLSNDYTDIVNGKTAYNTILTVYSTYPSDYKNKYNAIELYKYDKIYQEIVSSTLFAMHKNDLTSNFVANYGTYVSALNKIITETINDTNKPFLSNGLIAGGLLAIGIGYFVITSNNKKSKRRK